MRARIMAFLACLCVISVAGSAAAQDLVPSHVHEERPRLFWWALPSDTGHGIGYYVGGGSNHPRKAEPRYEDEGTWGWDYSGWLVRRRVMLGWWHGRRMQGGPGAYQSEGARVHQEK